MINNGSKFDDAYFAINYVKVFSTAQPLDPVASGTQTLLTSATDLGASATGSGSNPSGTSGSSGSGGGSGAPRGAVVGVTAVVLGAVGAAFVWAMM